MTLVPISFTPGTIIRSADINANYTAIANVINTFVAGSNLQLGGSAVLVNSGDASQYFGFNIRGSSETAMYSGDSATSMISATGIILRLNNYNDGAGNDRWIANTTVATQVSTLLGAFFGIRQSTGTPTAGSVITWGTTYNLLTASGAARVWVQNTAPTATQTGDIWIDTSVNLG